MFRVDSEFFVKNYYFLLLNKGLRFHRISLSLTVQLKKLNNFYTITIFISLRRMRKKKLLSRNFHIFQFGSFIHEYFSPSTTKASTLTTQILFARKRRTICFPGFAEVGFARGLEYFPEPGALVSVMSVALHFTREAFDSSGNPIKGRWV